MSDGKKVYGAIHSVLADLSELGIEKNRKNQQQGFTFRGIDDVLQALSPILRKNKLLILPTLVERIASTFRTSKGTEMNHVTVVVDYNLTSAEDGSQVTVRFPGEAMDSGDKATSKAESMAFKYMAFQTFAIPFAGCDDGDTDSPHMEQPKAPKAEPPKNVKKPPEITIGEWQNLKTAALVRFKTIDKVKVWLKEQIGSADPNAITKTKYPELLAALQNGKGASA